MGIITESERIAIRDIELSDTTQFVNWWNDGNLMSVMGFKQGMGITEHELWEEFKNEITDQDPNRSRRRYVVIDRFSKRPIGEVVYGELDLKKKKCGVGIKLCEVSLQGQGLGKETLIAFMNYLFNHFQLERIELDSIQDNIRALSLYKKLGFKEYKTIENFWTDPSGISHHLIFLGIDKKDWSYA
ncbi:GNAT family protein [Anaerocolumna sp. AGMB13025]|uniref:GNAT family N-acetyltransferase n=1 Tax=Anaerocolumna sp. AGMB13025 TaxID=3039116 RepID=UPI00241D3C53|nr:GNAT family protein [Anaerocolumna sp. AGMB13025]WFR54879.1 GNAT family protein [Anaerocolumna sp. AGMB13025]